MIRADNVTHGDVVMLLLCRIADHYDVTLAFDRDYGMDKRTGWSVTVDGRVLVEFADDPLGAMALAATVMIAEQEQDA